MRKATIILLFSLLMLQPAKADRNSSAYDFLNVTSSARIYGLGGVNISTIEDNIETADQNPALLGPEMGGWIDANYMRYIGDSNFAGIRYAQGAGEHGAWMASVQYFGYGSVKETDIDGNVLGNFSPSDLSFAATYSHDVFSMWRIGATVKFLYSNYNGYSAAALATDLGINYYDPEHDFSLSLVGANLGGQVKKFDNVSETLHMDVRMGFTWGLKRVPLRISVTAWNLTRWKGNNTGLMRHLVFGLDLVPSSKFYVSLGYNYKVRQDMQTYQRNFLSGFTLGAGFSASRFNVAVALAQPHNGATTFMVNFGLKLQDLIR